MIENTLQTAQGRQERHYFLQPYIEDMIFEEISFDELPQDQREAWDEFWSRMMKGIEFKY